jgi:hypothetical protein
MNDKKHIEQDVAKILWNKFKPYSAYVAAITVSIIIFIFIVIPQYQELGQIREEEKATKDKITLLQNNVSFLASLDEQTVNKDFDIAFTALPAEKDFVGIINGITRSSVNAGVILNDFSFNVGTLASQSAVVEVQPSIKIDLSVQGNISATNQFIKNLSETFPMSSPISLSMSNTGSSVQVSFFYKPITPANGDVSSPIQKMSSNDGKLIQTLEPQYDAIKQSEEADPFAGAATTQPAPTAAVTGVPATVTVTPTLQVSQSPSQTPSPTPKK